MYVCLYEGKKQQKTLDGNNNNHHQENDYCNHKPQLIKILWRNKHIPYKLIPVNHKLISQISMSVPFYFCLSCLHHPQEIRKKLTEITDTYQTNTRSCKKYINRKKKRMKLVIPQLPGIKLYPLVGPFVHIHTCIRTHTHTLRMAKRL